MQGMYGVYTLRAMRACKVTRAAFECMSRDDPKHQQVMEKVREFQQVNLKSVIKGS